MAKKKLAIPNRPKCIYHDIEMYLHGHTKDGRQKFICPKCNFTRLSKIIRLSNENHSHRKFYDIEIVSTLNFP